MGVNIFGHKPPFRVEAVKQALDRGIPLAGYSEATFEAAKLFCEITGHERMLFTQSGTESVMWAVRIARAATQRKKIVLFEESYHGLSDAVLAARDNAGRSYSVVPGVLEEFAEQIIVLEYGNMRDLDAIEERAGEIACVLVEPVQSRHPYRKPAEFLHELRKLTLEKDIVLIFDEMITGFRVCPKGAQGHFGIRADLATYGKIPGGGMPTGIVAGLARYMDLVDGGSWNFGDGSMPKAKRTSVAGTHTQNPLKVAAVLASLTEIKNRCSDAGDCGACTCFQQDLNRKTREMTEELNGFFAARRLAITLDHFGSLFRFRFLNSYWDITEALFFLLLRMNGVETNIQGNCFLTTAHGEEDIRAVIKGVQDSVDALLEAGFFIEAPAVAEAAGESAGPAPGPVREPERIQVKVARSLTEEQAALLRNLIKADLQGFQMGRV
jgi:glutamate-1-semialdehyde 2,1-aminomutase